MEQLTHFILDSNANILADRFGPVDGAVPIPADDPRVLAFYAPKPKTWAEVRSTRDGLIFALQDKIDREIRLSFVQLPSIISLTTLYSVVTDLSSLPQHFNAPVKGEDNVSIPDTSSACTYLDSVQEWIDNLSEENVPTLPEV